MSKKIWELKTESETICFERKKDLQYHIQKNNLQNTKIQITKWYPYPKSCVVIKYNNI